MVRHMMWLTQSTENRTSKHINEEHYLKVVLQILHGKPIMLNLRGMTLAPLQGLLAVRKTDYVLPAVPIGLLNPVTFPIEIHNVGSGKISYKVDQTDFFEKDNESKKPIFSVKNPEGMLNPNDKCYLYCRFNPLEAKEYEFTVPVIVSDFARVIQEVQLNVRGRGYNIRPPKQENVVQEEMATQRSLVSSLGSQVFFSIEQIDFGEISSQKPEYRLIILYNASKDKKLHFDFYHKTGLVW